MRNCTVLCVLCTLNLVACSDPNSVDCAEAPEITYDNFGQAFLVHNCQGCHASTAHNRYGAPDSMYFDSVDDAWQRKDAILSACIGASATMPPAGSISEDDALMLQWWLECGNDGE